MVRPTRPKDIKPKAEGSQSSEPSGGGFDSNKLIMVNTITTVLICVLFIGGNYFVQDKLLSSKLQHIQTETPDGEEQEGASTGPKTPDPGISQIEREITMLLGAHQASEQRLAALEAHITAMAAAPVPAAAEPVDANLINEIMQLKDAMEANAKYDENLSLQIQNITAYMEQLARSQDGLVQMSAAIDEISHIKASVATISHAVETLKWQFDQLQAQGVQAEPSQVPAPPPVNTEIIDHKINEALDLFSQMAKESSEAHDTNLQETIGKLSALESSVQAIQAMVNERLEHAPAAAAVDTAPLDQGIDELRQKTSTIENLLLELQARVHETPQQGPAGEAKGSEALIAGLEEQRSRAEQYQREFQNLKSSIDATYSLYETMKKNIDNSKSITDEQMERINSTAALIHFIEEKTGGVKGLPSSDSPIKRQFESDIRTELNFSLKDLLDVMIQHNATVLHIRKDSAPTVRVDGELIPVGDIVLKAEDCAHLLLPLITREQQRQLIHKEELSFSHLHGNCSFVFDVFIQRSSIGIIIKMHPTAIPTLNELHIPEPLRRYLSNQKGGLIIVSGMPDSGKTTVAASIIDHLNTNNKLHIVTLESPLEFSHIDKMSLVTQRELGVDFASISHAIRQSLSKDIDVMFISELNTPEILMNALFAADSGCLVISTIASPDAVRTIEKIIDTFGGEEKRKAQILLSRTLKLVISTRMLNAETGSGKIPALEILLNNHEISKLIAQSRFNAILPLIDQGSKDSMRTFSQAITQLLENGTITEDEAQKHLSELTNSSQLEMAAAK